MKRETVCNEDCFHCPFPDCIRDSATLCDIDYADPAQAASTRKEKLHLYYLKNRDRILAYQRAYRERNIERCRAHDRAYYQAHKKQKQQYNKRKYLEKKRGEQENDD